MSVIKDPTYQLVNPTQKEQAAARKRYHGHLPGVYFVVCRLDGTRFWYSGLGKGAHERGAVHCGVERAMRLAGWYAQTAARGPERVAEMDTWAAANPEHQLAKDWLAAKAVVMG